MLDFLGVSVPCLVRFLGVKTSALLDFLGVSVPWHVRFVGGECALAC